MIFESRVTGGRVVESQAMSDDEGRVNPALLDQFAVHVILIIASRGFNICGSGTFSTRTSLFPYQQRAFIKSSSFKVKVKRQK
jgi:hypothetical protein